MLFGDGSGGPDSWDSRLRRVGSGLVRVMRRWELPGWTAGVGEALVTDRTARAMTGGALGPVRRLGRGIGMGGPGSMLVAHIALSTSDI